MCHDSRSPSGYRAAASRPSLRAVGHVMTDSRSSRTGPGVTGAYPRDDGRQEHFLRLAALVHEPLLRYARRRVGPADVDDIAAETLLVLWRRLDDVPADAA